MQVQLSWKENMKKVCRGEGGGEESRKVANNTSDSQVQHVKKCRDQMPKARKQGRDNIPNFGYSAHLAIRSLHIIY